jgi:hypothetical protein
MTKCRIEDSNKEYRRRVDNVVNLKCHNYS